MAPIARSRRSRGSSFIEILIALAILALLMVGILQMFSLALLTNVGSGARTDLLYKAQQVVENLRLVYALEATGNPAARTAAGVPATLAATASPVFLPHFNGDTTSLTWAYWGPTGAGIIDEEYAPYRVFYTVADRDALFWEVTVTAAPVDNPELLRLGVLGAPPPQARRYRGPGAKVKIVTYSAQIEK